MNSQQSKNASTTTTANASIRENILQELARIDRPGDFCVSADQAIVLPGLEVDNIGLIGLPLTTAQAKQLIKVCQQAPYGKGTETVVDTKVRKVWELDPKHFKLTNKKWNTLLSSILVDVQKSLGLNQQQLSPQLYKLLVYEKGGFFLPHRDGEKLDGMVATLVLALPSVHTGGELIVSHGGQSQSVAMSGAATGCELSYAAFYADCEHEVRPVKSGYRLCLTYNLILKPSVKKTSAKKSASKKTPVSKTRPAKQVATKNIGAPDYQSNATNIANSLKDWNVAPNSLIDADAGEEDSVDHKKSNAEQPDHLLAITLDHRYTQNGLSFTRLKGTDQARANTLFEAAEQAGFVAHLALLTNWQSGASEDEYDYDYGRGRWGRDYYGYDDEDDEDDDVVSSSAANGDDDEKPAFVSQHTMGEIYDGSLTANHWSDRDGNPVDFGEICIDETSLVSSVALGEWEIGKEDFEGYTGNAGMTLERWYHRAAVVVWPREKHFRVLCNAGTDAAIAGLQKVAKKMKRGAKKMRELERIECQTFATAIIDTWQVGSHYRHSYGNEIKPPTSREMFCDVLQLIDDPKLTRRYIDEVLRADASAPFGKSLVAHCQQHGWDNFATELNQVFQSATPDQLMRNQELLATISLFSDNDRTRQQLCQQLGQTLLNALIAHDQPTVERRSYSHRQLDRAALTALFVKSMLAVGGERVLRAFLEMTLADETRYPLTETQLAAIFNLEPTLKQLAKPSAAIKHWLKTCQERLQTITRSAPQPPADFRRPHKIACKCKDCKSLIEFLDDPHLDSARMPMAKARRQHLHQAIDRNRIDCTHVTLRQGSPHILVLKKTNASYNAACTIFKRDQQNEGRLKKIIND